MGFLFGGSKEKTSTESTLPPYVKEAGKKAVGLATDLAEQPYTPYTGARVAGQTQNQKRAEGQAWKNFAQPQDMITSGYALARKVGDRAWSPQAAERYMNPFVESALDPAIRRINEEARQNAIGTRAGQIIGGGVGAFGDARTGVLEGELEEARLRGVGDTLATGYANAYDRAQQAFESENDRRLRAADLMGTQGGRFRATSSSGIADLASTGLQKQGQQQRSLDTAYGDYLEGRDWKGRGLNYYISALNGIPFEQKQTSSGNTGASPAQQLVGAGIAGAGLYNAFFS